MTSTASDTNRPWAPAPGRGDHPSAPRRHPSLAPLRYLRFFFRDAFDAFRRAWEAGNPECTGGRGGEGGAIVNLAGSALVVDLGTFVDNRGGRGPQSADCLVGQPGGRGGAIASFGDLIVRRSAFSGNRAGDEEGRHPAAQGGAARRCRGLRRRGGGGTGVCGA